MNDVARLTDADLTKEIAFAGGFGPSDAAEQQWLDALLEEQAKRDHDRSDPSSGIADPQAGIGQ